MLQVIQAQITAQLHSQSNKSGNGTPVGDRDALTREAILRTGDDPGDAGMQEGILFQGCNYILRRSTMIIAQNHHTYIDSAFFPRSV